MRPIPYLKGLDILRFLAAALVVLAHAHYHLSQLGIPWHDKWHIMYQGQPAVAFFFTLSGVLLTCLGIQEQALRRRIDIKKFYFRRMLRIWPLYYGVVALSLLFVFVLLPVFYPSGENRFPMPVSLLCLLFIIPNYLSSNGLTSFGPVNVLWSIGVEEAFYLLFPLLLLLHKKTRSYIFIFAAALILHLCLFVPLLYSQHVFPVAIKRFLCTYAFQYMLVGCVFAAVWMKCRENKNAQRWFNAVALLLGITAAVLFVNNMVRIPWIMSVVKSVLFSVIILFTAQVNNRFFRNNPLVYTGKISYGIYVFHPFVSYFLRFLCTRSASFLKAVQQMPLLYFTLLLGLSIGVAHLSYRFYERRFLALKERIGRV